MRDRTTEDAAREVEVARRTPAAPAETAAAPSIFDLQRTAGNAAVVSLLTEAPRLLADPGEQLRPEDVANVRLILERLVAVSPLQAMRFARQGLRALPRIEGRTWREALEFMSRAKPRGRTLRRHARRQPAS